MAACLYFGNFQVLFRITFRLYMTFLQPEQGLCVAKARAGKMWLNEVWERSDLAE
jgi:hypothetical protein